VRGESAGTLGQGVYGEATASSSVTSGVLGVSTSTQGRGVTGLARASTGNAYGVNGQSKSTEGRGVSGLATASSGTTYGVRGESYSPGGRGALGIASAAHGTTYGVRGESYSPDGRGVFGLATASSGFTVGVWGESYSPDGFGGYFLGKGFFSGDVFTGGDLRASGDLVARSVRYISPRTHYLSLSAPDFIPNTNCCGYRMVNGQQPGLQVYSKSAIDGLVAAVHLPDGARVTRLTGYWHDTDKVRDLRMLLIKVDLTNGDRVLLAEVVSSGTPGYQNASDLFITNATVRNQTAAYYIKVHKAVCGFLDTCGGFPEECVLLGAVIHYTITEAD